LYRSLVLLAGWRSRAKQRARLVYFRGAVPEPTMCCCERLAERGLTRYMCVCLYMYIYTYIHIYIYNTHPILCRPLTALARGRTGFTTRARLVYFRGALPEPTLRCCRRLAERRRVKRVAAVCAIWSAFRHDAKRLLGACTKGILDSRAGRGISTKISSQQKQNPEDNTGIGRTNISASRYNHILRVRL